MKQFFQGKGRRDNQGAIEQVRANYERIQSLAAEKLGLARKIYAYVDANLAKISTRMKQMEEEDHSLTMKKPGKSEGSSQP